MAETLKYNLQQINNNVGNGFTWEIPEETMQMINYLCSEVGSAPITSSIYERKEPVNSFSSDKNKKRRGNKAMEISDAEWESLRSFQATKIEQKVGVAAEIDQLRALINKITDKTFLDIREKIIDKINMLVATEGFNFEDSEKISTVIYDIASTNKFYSKNYADLYAELVTTYDWLRPYFTSKYDKLIEQYDNIIYVDPDEDYDKFCEINKQNEKRRANTTFYLNLCKNGFIRKDFIVNFTKVLIDKVYDYIEKKDKKNEVDELTENIAILFNKEFIEEFLETVDEEEFELQTNDSIVEGIEKLAKMKAKDYPSLSNKSIFKYMDMVEM